MHDPKNPPHEWSERILRLATEMGLTQAGLAERLGVSPATVSRWIQGKYEPTAEGYVALGNLAQRSEGVYFWERAGVDTSAFPEASFRRAQSSLKVNLHDFSLIAGRKASKLLRRNQNQFTPQDNSLLNIETKRATVKLRITELQSQKNAIEQAQKSGRDPKAITAMIFDWVNRPLATGGEIIT